MNISIDSGSHCSFADQGGGRDGILLDEAEVPSNRHISSSARSSDCTNIESSNAGSTSSSSSSSSSSLLLWNDNGDGGGLDAFALGVSCTAQVLVEESGGINSGQDDKKHHNHRDSLSNKKVKKSSKNNNRQKKRKLPLRSPDKQPSSPLSKKTKKKEQKQQLGEEEDLYHIFPYRNCVRFKTTTEMTTPSKSLTSSPTHLHRNGRISGNEQKLDQKGEVFHGPNDSTPRVRRDDDITTNISSPAASSPRPTAVFEALRREGLIPLRRLPASSNAISKGIIDKKSFSKSTRFRTDTNASPNIRNGGDDSSEMTRLKDDGEAWGKAGLFGETDFGSCSISRPRMESEMNHSMGGNASVVDSSSYYPQPMSLTNAKRNCSTSTGSSTQNQTAHYSQSAPRNCKPKSDQIRNQLLLLKQDRQRKKCNEYNPVWHGYNSNVCAIRSSILLKRLWQEKKSFLTRNCLASILRNEQRSLINNRAEVMYASKMLSQHNGRLFTSLSSGKRHQNRRESKDNCDDKTSSVLPSRDMTEQRSVIDSTKILHPISKGSKAYRFPHDWLVECWARNTYRIRSPDGTVFESIKEGLDALRKRREEEKNVKF